jgi:LacI family transcriptional regulator
MIGKHTMRELSEHSIPVVTTINAFAHADSRIKVSSVIEDVDSAYMEMASELYRLGHRKIAVAINMAFVPYLDERLNILKGMLKKLGLEIRNDSFLSFNTKSIFSERNEAKISAAREMERIRKYTAIVAMSDLTAFGVCDALLEAGIEPGKDISVIGYNNLEASPLYPVKEPFLSTIDPLKEEKGKMIAEILLGMMSQSLQGVIVRKIQARYIPRHSLCPAKDIS